MELDHYRKLTQKDVKTMYDKSLQDKFKVKQMENQMDEVKEKRDFILNYIFICRKKMKNFVSTQKQRRRSLE
jgi:uncharacterized coiled-coil DUF342 family protein